MILNIAKNKCADNKKSQILKLDTN